MIPKIYLVAFEDRQHKFIFVAVPNERGRYLRTDHSVAQSDCPFCGAALGEPCHDGDGRYCTATHSHRRSKARRGALRKKHVGDVMETAPSIPDEAMEPVA